MTFSSVLKIPNAFTTFAKSRRFAPDFNFALVCPDAVP
jgi:hypothetical protein